MTTYAYGDSVRATYRPDAERDPHPVTRTGVVVDPGFADNMVEVYFGTIDEYAALIEAGKFQEGHNATGVFYPDELVKEKS